MRQSSVRSGVLVGALTALLGTGYYVATRHAPAPASNAPAVDPVVAQNEADLPEAEEEVPGEVAVDLRDDLSDGELAAIKSEYGLHPNSAWSARTTSSRSPTSTRRDEDAAPRRARRTTRASSTSSRWRSSARRSSRTIRSTPSKQWHLKRVGAETAWEYTCGQGVTVAVVDTGIACFDKGPFTQGTDLAGHALRRRLRTSSTTRAEAVRRPGPRHARRRHDRADDEQRHRRRGPRVLRDAHAGQGAHEQRLRHASRTSPRASASRPTTARRSSTCRSAVRSRAASSRTRSSTRSRKGVVVVAAAGNSGRSGRLSGGVPRRHRRQRDRLERQDRVVLVARSRGRHRARRASPSRSRRSATAARTSARSSARSTARAWRRRTSPASPRCSRRWA